MGNAYYCELSAKKGGRDLEEAFRTAAEMALGNYIAICSIIIIILLIITIIIVLQYIS